MGNFTFAELNESRSDDRRSCFRLLAASVFGALLGALAAKASGLPPAVPAGVLPEAGPFQRVLLASLFPLCLFLTDLSGFRSVLPVLFGGKAALVSYLLCVGHNVLTPEAFLLPVRAVLFHTVLPLPVYFFTGAYLLRVPKAMQTPLPLWLLAANAIVCSASFVAEALLF